jgi:DNA-binding transcriptional regulator YbjK
MTVRVPRQQRGEDRRDAILAAAVAVLSRHGPGAFSARAVATQAALPLAAVSYYFPRLDDLFGLAMAGVLSEWLAHGSAVAASVRSGGVDAAARAVTAALLPTGPPEAVRYRYEHLLAASAHPVATAALADLRPRLRTLIAQILTKTRTRTSLDPDVILALLDGAAVGAVSEGAADPRARVVSTLRAALGGGGQPRQSSKDLPEIRS